MADISKITLPSGVTYNIKDAQGRNQITNLKQSVWGNTLTPDQGRAAIEDHSSANDNLWGLVQDILLAIDHSGEIENVPGSIQSVTGGTYNDIFQTVSWLVSVVNGLVGGDAVIFIGVSTNKLTDGGTEAPTGTDYNTFASVPKGALVFYKTEEFIKGDDNKWHALGSLDTLGALAYKDSVSVSYTPVGIVSQPTFTGSTFMSSGLNVPVGTVSVSVTGNSNVTAAVSQASSGTTTYKPAGSVGSTFTGATKKITVSRMTGGSVNVNGSSAQTVAINQATSGTTTYQPAGVISAPTISASTAGATTTIKQVNAINNVVSALTVAEPGATAPANAITYYSVANETLSLKQIGATTAAPITTTNTTVKTGDANYSFSAPTFTGTAVRLTGSVAVPSSFAFNGVMTDTEYDVTPSGSIDSSFEGTPVRLITGNISVPNALGATFTGESTTYYVTGTPVGTISQPTFSGSASTITLS